MTIDDAILEEYKIYCERYDDYIDHDERMTERGFVQESERVIKILYKIKYGKAEIDDIAHWLAFWSSLSKGIVL